MTKSGILLVDKPTDWTSHDVVAKLRGVLGTRKVGHAGTLDPMATGLLVVGVNAGTKLLTYLVGADKTYLATIRLGLSTSTDDSEGQPIGAPSATDGITNRLLEDAIRNLTGEILQVPSSVSAVKVNGQRAYALVRGGVEVKLAARPVKVSRFDLLGEPIRTAEGFLDLKVVVDCSSGTYIRALARDLGANLGVGGHLTALRRTHVGGYSVEAASLMNAVSPESVIPLATAAVSAFAVRQLAPSEVVDLRHGKRIAAAGFIGDHAGVDDRGQLIAMLQELEGKTRSTCVFATDL